MHRSWLTPDDQLGGGSNVVDGGLRRAGVASGVLQLGILDKQLAVWAATLHEARRQGDKHIKTHHNTIFFVLKLEKGEFWRPKPSLHVKRD